MSCHVMSCHVMSSHVFSRLLTSCHVMSRHVMSCHVMSRHVMSRHVMSCHVMSRLVMSCHVISRPLTSSHVTSCHVMSRHVMSCHVMSRLVMSCHVISRPLTSSHVLSRLVISCHLARESCSRIFLPSLLNSSIMAPTRFSKPWPCAGIRLGATLSLWRRVHCERRRVAPCAFLGPGHRFAWQAAGIGRAASMSRACRGHAAALCRGDWVPGAFCACMANVRFAWQAVKIARAGRCVAGASRVRRGGRSAVGLGSGRVARARDFTRCDLRFAWQAWDFGCIDALGKALDGGSAWQRNESRVFAKKTLDFVALCNKSRARARVGRCEIVAGAGNPWICGCELGAGFSGNAAAGCVGRVGRAALCRGTQWQAVTMGVGRVARAARAALCHGDCCWACRVGGAVSWGLVTRASSGRHCVIGIADQGVVWVALCHWDW